MSNPVRSTASKRNQPFCHQAASTKIGNSSFTLHYGLFDDESGNLVADGSSVVVWFDYGAGASRPVPDWLRARINALDGVES